LTDLSFHVPLQLKLSPRRKGEFSLLIDAIGEYLTAPPGAPDLRGQKTLIIQEGPAILPFAASKFGSGELTLICKGEETKFSLDVLNELNEPLENMILLNKPLSDVIKQSKTDFIDYFSLIVTSISPYLLAKNLKFLVPWLKSKGRIIAIGFSESSWTSTLLKTAFKLGLDLKTSVIDGDYCSIQLQKPITRNALIWEWKPGDWLVNLNADELSLLDEAGKIDENKARKDTDTSYELDDDDLEASEEDGTTQDNLSENQNDEDNNKLIQSNPFFKNIGNNSDIHDEIINDDKLLINEIVEITSHIVKLSNASEEKIISSEIIEDCLKIQEMENYAEEIKIGLNINPTEEVNTIEKSESTDDLDTTDESEPTDDLDKTDESEPTDDLNTTDESEPTDDLDTTDESEPTDDLDTTDESEPTDDLDKTNDEKSPCRN
jgi:hypothetical protein